MQQHHTIVEVQDAARHALPQIAFRSRDGPESNSAKIVAANGIRRILDAMAIECVQDAVNFESKRGPRTASTWNELQEAALNILLILLGREPDDFAMCARRSCSLRAKHAGEASGASELTKGHSKTVRKVLMPRVCRNQSI
jgi:hypothetical protein